jgi:predicted enzyme related to lactoylglutathione lyase
MKKMNVVNFDHYNIETVKPEETVWFYSEVLGLENAPEKRPNMGGPGTWFLIAGHPAIHVNFVEKDRAGITKHKVSYEKVESPEINLCQLYVVDPNKIKIEMNIRGEL